jgi:hypothetical protein
MKEKQIQVSQTFYNNVESLVVTLLYGDYNLNDLTSDTIALAESLQNFIIRKSDAQERRHAFTLYKSSEPGSEVREAFRQEYLDIADIHEDWQTTKEMSI